MARFMSDGRYHTWISEEQNPHSIVNLDPNDPDRPQSAVHNRNDLLADLLNKRRRQLKTFLGQVAKCASRNMYASIVRHVTSLKWIYNKIKQDYGRQQKGIHFLNIINLKYDPETITPSRFYNKYWTLILNNIARANETIHWNNDTTKSFQQTRCWVHCLNMSFSSTSSLSSTQGCHNL